MLDWIKEAGEAVTDAVEDAAKTVIESDIVEAAAAGATMAAIFYGSIYLGVQIKAGRY